MIRPVTGLALTLLLLAHLPSGTALAAEGGGLLGGTAAGAAAGAPVELFALSVTRDEAKGIITAEGSVDLVYGRMRMQADRMVLEEEANILTATGNVRFQRADEYLTGQAIVFDLSRETGTVTGARGYIAEFYVKGEEIRKVAEKEYRILRGSVTPCEQETPDWSLASPDARVVVEDYIYAWHPTMWVKKVPVLYLPYLVAPIKTERATGLLVPSVGWSDSAGISYSQDLFWAMADNADATVGVDLYSRKGVRIRLEFRHALSSETGGTLSGSWIDDRKEGVERWRFQADQRVDLGAGLRGVADVDIVSDRDYATSFGDSLEERTSQDYTVRTSVRRRWGNLTATLAADLDRTVETDYLLGRLPELTLDLGRSRIIDGGPALEGRILTATRFTSHSGSLPGEQVRLMAEPRVSWPLHPGAWMTLTPSFAWHQAWYREGTDGSAVSRSAPEAQLVVDGPKVYRIFEGEGEGRRYRHLVEPRITLRYRDGIASEGLYRYDGRDGLAEAKDAEIALVSRLSARKEKEAARDLVRAEVRQRYDLVLRDDGNPDTDPLADMKLLLETQPLAGLTLRAAADYSHESGSLPQRSAEIGYVGSGGNSLRAEIRFADDPDLAYLGIGAGLALGKRWRVRFDGRYDLDAGKRVENRIGLDYTSQCWEVRASYTDRDDGSVFKFSIDLKNLGTILTI